MHLAEILPVHLRDAVGLVGHHHRGIADPRHHRWPLLLCVTIVPAIFHARYSRENPEYLLLSRDKDMDAQKGKLR